MSVETFLNGKVRLHAGDSRDVLKTLPDACIDSIVCDPPYALVSIVKRFGGANAAPAKGNTAYTRASRGFMGKTWDTGEVAFSEGFNAILIEREPEYQADIRRRMALCLAGPDERKRESIKAKIGDGPLEAGPLFANTEAAE